MAYKLYTDKTEVYLHPGSLKDSKFRTLRQGQRINFDIESIEGKDIIKNVKILRIIVYVVKFFTLC